MFEAGPFRNIHVRLSTNLTGFRAEMAAAALTVKTFGAEVTAVAQKQHANARMLGGGFVTMGAAIAAGFAVSVVAAAKFETAMRNAATISQAARRDFDGVGDTIIELSRTLPQSATEIARGFYDVASSGFDGAAGIHVVAESAKAASAGLTDTATSARAITAVLNAYGKSALEAGAVSDVLFQTVNLGVITFEELSQNIGDVVGLAAQLKVPIEDVGTALATITLGGVPAAEATTALNRVFQELLDPSEELAAALRTLGYESGSQAIEADGLQVVMQRLRESTHGNVDAFRAMFPEIRGQKGALMLLAAEGANYVRVSKGMRDAMKGEGATARALAEQQKALGYQWSILKNNVMAVAIQLGRGLLPVMKVVGGVLKTMVVGFEKLPGPVKTAGAVLAGLTAVVLVAAGSYLLLQPILVRVQQGMVGLAATSTVAAGAMRTFMAASGIGLAVFAASSILLGILGQRTDDAADAEQRYFQILSRSNSERRNANDADVAGEAAKKGLIAAGRTLGLNERETVRAIKTTTALRRVERDTLAEMSKVAGRNFETMKAAQLFATTSGITTHKAEADAVKALLDAYNALGAENEGYGRAVKKAREIVNAKAAVGKATREERSALEATGGVFANVAVDVDTLTESQKDLAKALDDAPGTMDAWTTALDRNRDALEAQIEAQGKTDVPQEWIDGVAAATTTLPQFTSALAEQNVAIEQWHDDLVTIAGQVGPDVAGQLASLGFEAAPLIRQFATSTAEEMTAAADEIRRRMGLGMTQMVLEIELSMEIARLAFRSGGDTSVEAIAESLNAGVDVVKAIIDKYGIVITDGVNNAVVRFGGKTVQHGKRYASGVGGNTGTVVREADGGVLHQYADGAHVAQIAPAGAMRLWAEPETGGEAYIPLAESKRARSLRILGTVAERFGVGLLPLDAGAVLDSLPRPPAFPRRPGAGDGGAAGADKMYADARSHVERKYAEAMAAAAADGTRGGGLAATKGLNPEFLARFQAYNAALGGTLRIVSGYRSTAQQAVLYARYLAGGGALAAPPGRSQHEKGLAIDHAPNSTAAMRAVARTHRLHYPVRGEPWHVEPFAKGGLHFGVYDRGGYLQPGLNLAVNRTGRPERVVGPGDDRPIHVKTTLVIEGNVYGDAELSRRMTDAADKRDRELARTLRSKR